MIFGPFFFFFKLFLLSFLFRFRFRFLLHLHFHLFVYLFIHSLLFDSISLDLQFSVRSMRAERNEIGKIVFTDLFIFWGGKKRKKNKNLVSMHASIPISVFIFISWLILSNTPFYASYIQSNAEILRKSKKKKEERKEKMPWVRRVHRNPF